LLLALAPACGVTLLLFGGGVLLGLAQALGYVPALGMDRLSTRHFARVLGDPDFLASLGLTLGLACLSTVLAAVLGLASALLLTALPARHVVPRLVFQIPLAVPHLVIALAVMFLLAPTGWLARLALAAGVIDTPAAFPLLVNDRWGVGILLAYLWKEVPFIALMVVAALQGAAPEWLEVGRTLKAGAWQRFRRIVLPTVMPALTAASLIVFAYTFGAFEIPYLLGRTYPMLLPVWAYRHWSDVDLLARPEAIATGMLIAALVGVLAILAQAVIRLAARRREVEA
jgi:putative spermidine/putrescine transport system permease protein